MRPPSPSEEEWRDLHPAIRREIREQWTEYRRQADAEAQLLTECAYPRCENPIARYVAQSSILCKGHALDLWIAYENAHQNREQITDYRLNRTLEERRRHHREAELAESRLVAPGWVYYLRIGDQIKIGFSTDVKQRVRQYPPEATLLAVHPGTLTLEAEMHQRFAAARAAGREWFHPHNDLMEHIGDVVGQFGEPTRFKHKYRTGPAQQIKPRRRSRR